MRRSASALLVAGVVAALVAAAPAGAASGPKVSQLVVFRAGNALQTLAVRAHKTRVKVGKRKCTVPSGSALAALALTKPPKLKLHDYGSCGKRARDAGGLFVRSIGGDANKGVNGWVYKVGNRVAPAGAADPSGPFGNGHIKSGKRLTWFYCHMDSATHGCEPTLVLKALPADPGTMRVHVTAYDDRGHGSPAPGALVRTGTVFATTDANGDATFSVPAGRYLVHAERSGSIRSFDEAVDVR
jgi:hypothetical protein